MHSAFRLHSTRTAAFYNERFELLRRREIFLFQLIEVILFSFFRAFPGTFVKGGEIHSLTEVVTLHRRTEWTVRNGQGTINTAKRSFK